jgi:hypothetical protein
MTGFTSAPAYGISRPLHATKCRGRHQAAVSSAYQAAQPLRSATAATMGSGLVPVCGVSGPLPSPECQNRHHAAGSSAYRAARPLRPMTAAATGFGSAPVYGVSSPLYERRSCRYSAAVLTSANAFDLSAVHKALPLVLIRAVRHSLTKRMKHSVLYFPALATPTTSQPNLHLALLRASGKGPPKAQTCSAAQHHTQQLLQQH